MELSFLAHGRGGRGGGCRNEMKDSIQLLISLGRSRKIADPKHSVCENFM